VLQELIFDFFFFCLFFFVLEFFCFHGLIIVINLFINVLFIIIISVNLFKQVLIFYEDLIQIGVFGLFLILLVGVVVCFGVSDIDVVTFVDFSESVLLVFLPLFSQLGFDVLVFLGTFDYFIRELRELRNVTLVNLLLLIRFNHEFMVLHAIDDEFYKVALFKNQYLRILIISFYDIVEDLLHTTLHKVIERILVDVKEQRFQAFDCE